MTRWLVMPRGINVGNRNRVPMPQLRPALEQSGFQDVATVLQSGNLILTGSADEATVIEQVRHLISTRFGVDVPCVARTAAEVRSALEAAPLAEIATDGSRHLVLFLSEQPSSADAASLEQEDHSPEVVRIIGRDTFVWTPNGVQAMTLSHTALEKRFGVTATARNWNTMQKIAARL